MVSRSIVTHDVTGAGRLAHNTLPIIIAYIATGAKDTHQAGLIATYSTTSTEHIGLYMDVAGAVTSRQHLFYPLTLTEITAASTIEINHKWVVSSG